MFDQLVSENTARTRRPFAVALSFAGQMLLVGLTILFPMLRTEIIAPGKLLRLVGAPMPKGSEREPSRKQPAGQPAVSRGPHVFTAPEFREPARVPDRILADESAPPAGWVAGPPGPGLVGTPGGVPWGTGIDISQVPRPAPPAPAPHTSPPARPPLRVSSGVEAARILHQVIPVYPPLARQARISGVVHLEAVISREGTVESLRVTSGHPLLAEAALEAVRQWVYRPTLLNGDPVEVLTEIDLRFKLGE
jgi:protein TonB